MWTSIRYVLLCALRDRLFLGLIAFVLAATYVSATLGGTAILEEKEMTLAFAAASARLILVVGLIVFTCFHLRSAFDSREIDVMLSRPISRPRLVFAYWMGFATVATLLLLPVLLIIAVIGVPDARGFAAWAGSLLLETWFVVALALFAALALSSAVSSVMACLGVYVLARMMVFFVMTATSAHDGSVIILAFQQMLKWMSVIVPRLDLFAQTQWLIYGVDSMQVVTLFTAQALIFIPLLLFASVIDFQRKQF